MWADIGDEQSIEQSLSTFSSHLRHIGQILGSADAQSLVLLDEIGRGTSTFDGLSLAWACAKYIAETVGALTLFATHYFELTALHEQLPATSNVHLTARKYEDRIIFMYSVSEGPASQSYGLQVARLAGVPAEVIEEAQQKLRQLEENEIRGEVRNNPAQSDLFFAAQEPNDALRDELNEVNIDELTPKDALNLLYELKSKL